MLWGQDTRRQDFLGGDGTLTLLGGRVAVVDIAAIVFAVFVVAAMHLVTYRMRWGMFGDDQVNDVAKYPYEFNVYPRPSTSVGVIIEHLKQEGYQRVAHIGLNDASGQIFSATLTKAGTASGLEIDSQLLDPAATDASPTLLKLQASHPDVLLVSGSFGYAPFFAGISKLGWNIPIVVDPNMAATNFVAVAAPNLLAHMHVLAFPAIVQGSAMTTTPAWKTFRAAVDKQVQGAKLTSPLQQYLQGYDAVLVAADGYDGAHSTHTDDVRKYLEKGSVPDRFASLVVGPKELGLSSTNHVFAYTDSDLLYTTVSGFNDGMLVP